MRASNLLMKWLAPGAAALVLAGCASTPAPVVDHSFGGSAGAASREAPAPTKGGAQTFGLGGHANGTVHDGEYTVAHGDTLYSVAFAHGMDVRSIAALNGLAPPYVIHPGQVLKLESGTGGATAAAAPVAPVVVAAPPRPAPVHTPPQSSAPVFGPVTNQPMTAGGVAEATTPTTTPVESAPVSAPVVAVPPPASAADEPLPSAPVAAAPAAMSTPPPGATRSVAGISWRWPASGKVVGSFKAGSSGSDSAGLDIEGKLGEPVRAAADGTVVYSGNGLIGYGELIIIKHNDSYLSAYGHNSKRLVKEGQHVSAGEEIALMGASGAPRVELHFEIRKDGKPTDPLAYLPAR